VCIGKTNVSQMLIFHESDNPVFGRCNNPFSLDRVPGGSSGGEAAAIAAGLSPGGVGTDIGGSIRVPAAFCGIAGIKPTVDRWSNIGSNSAIPGQEVIRSQCGPMARTAADVELFLRAIDVPQHSIMDPLVSPLPIGDSKKVKPKGLRVGFYFDDGFISASPAVQRAVIEACDVLSDAGVQVFGMEALHQSEILRVYLSALSADGAWHLDHAMSGESVMPQLRPLKAVVQLPNPIRKAALRGLELLGEEKAKLLVENVREKSVAELWQLTNKRTQLRRQVMDYWRELELDAVICPAHATPALGHGDSNDFTLAGSYSMRYNFLNLPAGVVPVTRVQPNEEGRADTSQRIDKKAAKVQQGSAGLPIGVQVVARPYREDVVLKLMRVIEDGVRGKDQFPVTPVELTRG
jgi:fatty acid amide hydrolase